MKHYNNMTRQAGMTLIELTVVLLILIGLAGLLVPYVGSFTQTTHDSTNSNNLTQLNNAMGRYITDKNHLPQHMDTLINSAAATAAATGSCTGAALNAVYCGLANPALFTAVPYAAATDLIPVESIVKSGISMAVQNNPDVANKTFGTSTGMIGLEGSGMMAFTGTQYFAAVAAVGTGTIEEHLAKALGRDPMVYNSTCYDYIAMGLGDNNELVQSTAASSPVFFPQDATMGPTERYAHFIAILQVDKDNSTAGCSGTTEKAKFLGVVANVPAAESDYLVGTNTLLAQGWQNRAAN
ncbi:type II secretion system protein [Methylobacter sp. sgz302048]|uniref:type II secretion system protein n=1 Tax=Methylobacter sp. sgz302048 TaxID=3455945 RepID=UPI003FA03CA3